MGAQKKILIIGGGEFGLTAALALRKRNWEVTLLEAGALPCPTAASTDISKVVRMDYGSDELHTRLGELSIEGWKRWNRDWNQQLYQEDGFLVLTHETLSPNSFEGDSFSFLTSRGHKLRRLDASEIASEYPLWAASGMREGYFNPSGGWAAAGQAMLAVANQAVSEGVVIRENARVEQLREENSRVIGVRCSGGEEIRADLVLATAGAWTPTLLPELKSVMWATGQAVLLFQVDSPAEFQPPRFPVWAADIARTGWYGFPALDDGTLKIANHGPGRRVHPDEPRDVTPDEIAAVRKFLRDSLPQIANAPVIRTRLCLYCDTFDGDFWIDHDPDRPGLVVAAGDSGHAFKFAPVLGDLVADAVERNPNPALKQYRWRSPDIKDKEEARFKT